MSNAKVVMGQAANTLAKPLEVEDVFSTYLYDGDDLVKTITNGIDLDGEGGLVWIKSRDSSTSPNFDHMLFDTERGVTKKLASNTTAAELTNADTLTAFNSNGFTIDDDDGTNKNLENYASWTFRKAPKFFDVVTYTGDGVAGRKIAHNLGSVPGTIIIKGLDNSYEWIVYHRGMDSTAPEDYSLFLNTTVARQSRGASDWNSTAPTATEFTLGSGSNTNSAANQTYVAYLFAHNDGDGEFGPDGDADIIKCGSYTGNGSGTAGPTVDLGFEPQWILTKRTNSTGYWTLVDAMRGMVAGGDDKLLYPHTSDAEQQSTRFVPSATGFQVNSTNAYVNASGGSYIYIAIRRGTKVPESGTEVFSVSTRNASEPAYTSGFPVDFALARAKNIANNWDTGSRLQQGNRMFTNLANGEASNSNMMFDYQDGWSAGTGASTEYLSWMWKRAPNFCDVVAYTGNGTAGRTVSHNLGVAPEMMWVKKRNASEGWQVYHSALTATDFMELNQTFSASSSTGRWNNTEPTATDFTLGSITHTNASGDTYIAYLFASLPNVSKCGSYTGNGTSQNIDCGFTSGARFVLIKVTSSADNWFMWDTLRGISVGPDSYLRLDITNAETDGNDRLDPYSGGFAVRTNDTSVNKSGESYIFYAIA